MIGRRRMHGSAWLGDQRIAESDDVVVVEGVAYFPLEHIRDGVLTRSHLKTLCYWKGVASYFHVTAGDVAVQRSAWTYRHPSPLARAVKGRVAFWYEIEVRVGDADT